MSDPASKSTRTLALMVAGAAIVMAGIIVWGAVQATDPLEDFIRTDKVRHILAFGAIGLCAGLMPLASQRLIALGAVVCFGVMIEAIQIPIPNRTASLSDLFASTVGGFGGFGLGAAMMGVWEQARRWAGPQKAR